ncbi:General substrate transporter [Amanita muscaria]
MPPSEHHDANDPTLTIDPVTLAYSYSYGPSGLAGLRHNSYALICACLASIGGLSFGYDQGVIANVLVMSDFKKRWPITSFQVGAMTAILELGALAGAILAGIFADRYSRRHSIFVASIIFCIGSSFQCGAQSLSDIFFGRAVGGIGVGALSMLSPLYMAEISPPELRGSLTAIEQFSIVLGVVFGFWTGFFTRSVAGSFSWRIPLAIQIIPGIILALGCIYLPPSPRLLVLQGRYDEALQSLAKLRGVSIELLEMKVEASLVQRLNFLHDADTDTNKSGLMSEWKAWNRLFSPKYRERTLIGVLIMFFQQWSGINALLYYGPILMKSVGLGSGNSNGSEDDTATLMVSGGIGIVQFLSVFPVILIIDKLGRKPLLRCGSIFMTFSHLTIALLVYQFSDNWTQHRSAAWICVFCMYLFTASYGISFGPVGWVLPSEVFPSSIRSKGVALSIASNWINNFLIGLTTPFMMEVSPPITFGTFGIACFIAYFWSTYRVPETANLSLEEMDAVFQDGVGREDQEIRIQIEEDMGLRGLIREVAEGHEDVEVRGSL